MTSKLVNVRIPEQLYDQGRKIAEEKGYRNVQELVLVGFREKVHEEAKTEFLRWLERTRGSIPNMKRLTKQEREKIAREHTPEKGRAILKKYGLLQ